jgi:predicted permease
MSFLRNVITGLRSLFRKEQVDRELDEELGAYLEMEAAEKMKEGMSRKEALRAVRLERGSLEITKEVVRSGGWESLVETCWQDLRFAARMLRKSPGFASVAVLTLALGIGANTAIFSLLDGLVLRDLPVPHPEELVHVAAYAPDNSDSGLSLPMFEEIARDQRVFSSMFMWEGEGIENVQINGSLSSGDVWPIDGNFYADLGAVPFLGRLIGPQDVDLNSEVPTPVAVLGYDFWRLHYGRDRSVIGKTISIEEIPFTIIGVTRPGFAGMTIDIPFEIAVPLTTEPLIEGHKDVQKRLKRRDGLWYQATGRLKRGVTLEQARAQLDSLWPAIRSATIPTNPELRARFLTLQLRVVPDSKGSSYVLGRFSTPLYVLLGISGLVLLIACLNLASLMLSRAAARGHELGVRVALGASRWRLARHMLIESVMLSLAGTVAGLGFAYWTSHALSDFILGQIYSIPAQLNLAPDWRILGFTAGIAIFTGVLFGFAPALKATREDPNAALQHSSRTLGRGTGRLGGRLIVSQVALSVVLLMGAGLFVRTLKKLREANPGFRTHSLLSVGIVPKPNAYENLNLVSYYHELTDRIAALPGVDSAGMVRAGLGNILEWTQNIRTAGTNTEGFTADFDLVTPGAFRAIGIALLSGRSFDWQDDDHAPHVAILSKNLAEKLFPRGGAIGRHLDVTSDPTWQNLEVVGIVSDASLYDIRKDRPPTMYVPSPQYGEFMKWPTLLVQTSMPPAAIGGALRQTVESLGHEYISSINSVQQSIDHSILQERITAMLSAFFGVLALLLAAIGLYGLMAYAVTQRTREIGIRMALGAKRSGVLKTVLRQTLVLVGTGVAIGLPCALAATRLVGHMLYGVSPNDPVTLACVVGALVAVGVLGGYLPARRAMKVDPMVALRYE